VPTKTGGSHALAAFVSIVLGSLISNFLAAHTGLLTALSRSVGSVVTSVLGVSVPWRVTGMAVIATGLAFVWGVAYHYSRLEEMTAGEVNQDVGATTTSQADARPSREHANAESNSVGQAEADRVRETIPAYSYRTPEDAKATDRAIRETTERKLSMIRSALDRMHDTLYDQGARDDAERVAEIREHVALLRQRVETSTPSGDVSTVAAQSYEPVRRRLVECDAELITAIEDVEESVADTEAGIGPERDSYLTQLERQLANIEQILSKRQNILEQDS
jgi:hypothetical protein